MISFGEYLHNSLDGLLTNVLFMAILLALIVSDLRKTKYLKWENKIKGEGFDKDFWRGCLVLLSYAIVIPLALIVLTFVIFILWLISFLL